jgi:hypothetical protein
MGHCTSSPAWPAVTAIRSEHSHGSRYRFMVFAAVTEIAGPLVPGDSPGVARLAAQTLPAKSFTIRAPVSVKKSVFSRKKTGLRDAAAA